jgi:cob(I)alamin adenosyltransferase
MDEGITKRKIYTGVGDSGYTNLAGTRKISKANLRIEACGTIDELNAFLGFAIVALKPYAQLTILVERCLRIQNELFDLGAQLSSYPLILESTPIISMNEIKKLEAEIDSMDLLLPPLGNFIFPGGNEAVVRLQLVRTVCRRLERVVVRLSELVKFDATMLIYINRLSDWFFVAGRFTAATLKQPESIWHKIKEIGR